MIDKLLSILGQRDDVVVDPNYNPRYAVIGHKFINRRQNRLVVLFPPWHGGGWFFRRLTERLAKKGWAVLAYQFSPQILEAEDKAVVDSYRYIQKRVVSDLESLSKNYQEIKFIGLSLGTVSLMMVADKFPRFTSATIVVGGDDLAVDSWHSIRVTNIRKAFENEHIGIIKLGNDWHRIAPKNHVKNFKNKPVLFIVSVKDKIILTKYQYVLVRAIEEAGGLLTVRKSRVGHIPSTVFFCLFGRLD